MNIDSYLMKIYNVAFRLTGDETKAADLAFNAIESSSSNLKLNNMVDTYMLDNSVKEVCKLYLSDINNGNELFKRFEKNTYSDSLQDALMSLNKISRTIVVWRDVLGLKLEDLNLKGFNKKELYLELNNSRKLLKDILYVDYVNEKGT